MHSITKKLQQLDETIQTAISMGITPQQPHAEKALYDFKAKKSAFYQNSISTCMREIQKQILDLQKTCNDGDRDGDSVATLLSQLKNLEDNKNSYTELHRIAKQMKRVSESLPKISVVKQPTQPILSFTLPNLPPEIKEEMMADMKEAESCFQSGCYRSAVILCARLLETALHRKYYDVTGKDILETSPGIGLGSMVAKLTEKNVQFDPGLTQQIHLVNNVRIFSVHKKQQVFLPTKEQAHATILFTMDSVGKLFER